MSKAAFLCLLALPMTAAFTAPVTGFSVSTLRAGRSPIAANPLGQPLAAASRGFLFGELHLALCGPPRPAHILQTGASPSSCKCREAFLCASCRCSAPRVWSRWNITQAESCRGGVPLRAPHSFRRPRLLLRCHLRHHGRQAGREDRCELSRPLSAPAIW